MIKHIPNVLTAANLFMGVSGILYLFADQPIIVLYLAVGCLVADLLDGLVARRLSVDSEIGMQLDSLADVVSFGVLPAAILAWLVISCSTPMPLIVASLAGLVAVGTALRLAIFNTDTRDKSVFYGLPSPSSAVIVFSILLIVVTDHPWSQFLQCNTAPFYILIVLLPLLMLSDLRLWSFKGLGAKNGRVILGFFLVVLTVSILLSGSGGALITAGVYLLSGLLNKLINVY